MSTPDLSETSYAVLGLVEQLEPATPYQLKRVAQVSLLHFWSIPHTQIYTECARLAELGLLAERREQTGRRRRLYRLTAAGRRALEQWRSDPETGRYELRDPGLLKLFCAASPELVAPLQLERHRQQLRAYEKLAAEAPLTDGQRLALDAGIGHEREYVRFWTGVLDA
jgi:PadR family transcriptional regulator, regulatory protein AphA